MKLWDNIRDKRYRVTYRCINYNFLINNIFFSRDFIFIFWRELVSSIYLFILERNFCIESKFNVLLIIDAKIELTVESHVCPLSLYNIDLLICSSIIDFCYAPMIACKMHSALYSRLRAQDSHLQHWSNLNSAVVDFAEEVYILIVKILKLRHSDMTQIYVPRLTGTY